MNNTPLNEKPRRIDRLQLASVAGLMLIGLAFVYSATMAGASEAEKAWYAQTWFKQVIWYALGSGAAAALCLVDYRFLARWSVVAYWAMILCLVAVLIPNIGQMHGWGARRWIDLPFFQFQPSEFAKLAFILALANFLSRPPDELRQPRIFWLGMGMMMLPAVLILKEPDLGSALVFLPTGLIMMLAAGTPRGYLLKLGGMAALFAGLFIVDIKFLPVRWQLPMQDYQRNRLLIYFGRDYTDFAPPDATPAELRRLRLKQADDGYNIRQALISVGSGGLFGKGWRQGTQNALGYLPRSVAHNDFIFSVIAEEEGFVGSVMVLTLYGVLLFTGLRIAGQARDRLGKLVAVGVVALIFSHVFINIGMNIRIMPVTGVPLPLLSYGGSSVLSSLLAVGLLQNIYIHRNEY